MADLPSDRLGLRAASEHLLVQPRVLLHCVKKVVRPNGGTLLPAIDVEGDTHFLRSDLEAFDADLRKQWVDPPDTKRVAIPQVFQEALRFEALTKCGLCGALYATEFAHIEPWEICLHNHLQNIICLCPKCHTGFDVEHRIPAQAVQTAKSSRERAVLGLIFTPKPAERTLVTTLQSLCQQIARILDENSVLFWNFGPRSELAEETAEPSAVIPWHEGILSTILPNNRTIADLLRENAKLLSVDEELHRVAETFLAHEASYRTFLDKPNVAHARFPFPTDFDQRVRELGAGDDV